MITTSRFFKEKQYMWYKVRASVKRIKQDTDREAPGSGQKHRAEISADVPGRFCKAAEFASQIHAETGRIRGVCAGTLEEYPYISAARIHDWLKECYRISQSVRQDRIQFCRKGALQIWHRKEVGGRIRRDYEKLPDTYGSMRRRISGRNGCQRETAEARKSIFCDRPWHVHVTSSPFRPPPFRHGTRHLCTWGCALSISEETGKDPL